MTARQCICGFTEDEAGSEMIGDHLLEVFAPDDGKGADGLVHLEGDPDLTCTCGLVAAKAAELDAHLLAVFTPDNAIGRDGKTHHPVSAAADESG